MKKAKTYLRPSIQVMAAEATDTLLSASGVLLYRDIETNVEDIQF